MLVSCWPSLLLTGAYSMPILHRLSRFKICLYPGDHLPPHFHVRFNDGREALVAIETLEVLGGGRRRGSLSSRWNGRLKTVMY